MPLVSVGDRLEDAPVSDFPYATQRAAVMQVFKAATERDRLRSAHLLVSDLCILAIALRNWGCFLIVVSVLAWCFGAVGLCYGLTAAGLLMIVVVNPFVGALRSLSNALLISPVGRSDQ